VDKAVHKVAEGERSYEVKIPPPYPGGEDTHESLGPFVDRLMGHGRDARKADAALAHLLMKQEDAPADPEPVEIPEPIPDADQPVERGRWPGAEKGP
jgi:hypothetical protein